jgi:hypothetical protein
MKPGASVKRLNLSIRGVVAILFLSLPAMVSVGCETMSAKPEAAKPAAAKPAEPPAVALPTIRINAGAIEPITDSQGVAWQADTGFDDGLTNDRVDLQITGTSTPELYRTERYSMNSYSVPVPNGKYTLKLHFSEDFEGIFAAEERLFTYTVKDGTPAAGKTIKEVKDFSPWKAAGAQYKAYIDTMPVTVTSGQISITFTPQVENPQINAIEIIPQ